MFEVNNVTNEVSLEKQQCMNRSIGLFIIGEGPSQTSCIRPSATLESLFSIASFLWLAAKPYSCICHLLSTSAGEPQVSRFRSHSPRHGPLPFPYHIVKTRPRI